MTNEEYVNLCKQTESSTSEEIMVRLESSPSLMIRLLHASMGMQTETSEFTDAIKKHLFYGKPLDQVHLKEELGDSLWYHSIALDALGLTYEEVMKTNIAKLSKRYPNLKFSNESALNRDLDAERTVLETE